METTKKIIIFDTTLRDGEQSPGGAMLLADKVSIAKQLDIMGVDIIEAGFATVSKGDFQCIQEVCKNIKNATVCCLARAKSNDIEIASLALKWAKKPRIHTFFPTSDLHLNYQLRLTQTAALDVIKNSVQQARNYCDDVQWSAMDSTRSNIDFLARAVEVAISAGASTINLADTVGYTTPTEYSDLIHTLKEKVLTMDKIILSAHCHNDLGLAVANTLAAITAGARQVECTINGIGERAGNSAMEEIIMAIKTRQDQFPFRIDVDPRYFATISKLVSKASGFAIQKNKAIVGANAFAHASGIHQEGMLKHRQLYEIIAPESLGFKTFKLVMSKHAGRAAFCNKLLSLGFNFEAPTFESLFQDFKQLGDQQKNISDEDIIALIQKNDLTRKK